MLRHALLEGGLRSQSNRYPISMPLLDSGQWGWYKEFSDSGTDYSDGGSKTSSRLLELLLYLRLGLACSGAQFTLALP